MSGQARAPDQHRQPLGPRDGDVDPVAVRAGTPSPRGTSAVDDAVIDTITTGASWPWNLSTVPTRTSAARPR